MVHNLSKFKFNYPPPFHLKSRRETVCPLNPQQSNSSEGRVRLSLNPGGSSPKQNAFIMAIPGLDIANT